MEILSAILQASAVIHKELKTGGERFLEPYGVGAGGDIGIIADKRAEEIFVDFLKPFGEIISEESGVIKGESRENIFCLDPLDGSNNYACSFPYYGASIHSKGKENLAVVVNFCNLEVIYRDCKGVFIGDLNTQDFKPFVNSPQSTKIGIFEGAYQNAKEVEKFFSLGLKFRSPGALALSLANARRVNFVFFKGEIRDYDILAGLAISQDLYHFQDKNLLLISQHKNVFDKILSFI